MTSNHCFLSPGSVVRRGVLLVNFGTPADPSSTAILAFLSQVFKEYLPAMPWFFREWWVVPRRLASVAKKYQAIWTPQGSPLLVQSALFGQALASTLSETAVVLGMQFGSPSIEEAVELLRPFGIEELCVWSFVPEPSISQRILQATARWPRPPHIHTIQDCTHTSWYRSLLANRLVEALPERFERVVFSFHSLPVRSFPSYREACLLTAQAIGLAARLPEDKMCVAFQSEVGRKGWTEPSTRRVVAALADTRVQRVLVICPSFVVDCLENLYEVGCEYRSEFLRRGGIELALVPSLNQFQPWVDAASTLVQKSLLTCLSAVFAFLSPGFCATAF